MKHRPIDHSKKTRYDAFIKDDMTNEEYMLLGRAIMGEYKFKIKNMFSKLLFWRRNETKKRKDDI